MKKVISLVLLLVLAASLGYAQAEALDSAVVGSAVTFGNYEQGEGPMAVTVCFQHPDDFCFRVQVLFDTL